MISYYKAIAIWCNSYFSKESILFVSWNIILSLISVFLFSSSSYFSLISFTRDFKFSIFCSNLSLSLLSKSIWPSRFVFACFNWSFEDFKFVISCSFKDICWFLFINIILLQVFLRKFLFVAVIVYVVILIVISLNGSIVRIIFVVI